MHRVTAENLHEVVEFDTPFYLGVGAAYGIYRDALDYAPGHDLGHAPSVYVGAEVDRHGDAHINTAPKVEGFGWGFYSRGYTAQYGVESSDPVMHESEDIGGKLARDMIDDGGTYVVTSVRMLTDSEEYDDANDDDLVGWVVLRKDEE